MSNISELFRVLGEYITLPEYSGYNNIDVNTKSLFGDYPIHIAATRGCIEEIKILLASGADINAKGEHGYTPLHDAVEQGYGGAVKFLLDQGADKSLKNDDGDTALSLACNLEENIIERLFADNPRSSE
jgi:ankyrin repeat protein